MCCGIIKVRLRKGKGECISGKRPDDIRLESSKRTCGRI